MHKLTDNAPQLVEVIPADLDRIMAVERQGFATHHHEGRSAYAQRIANFAQGSLMALRGAECVGCVFSEIWPATPQLDAAHLCRRGFCGHALLEWILRHHRWPARRRHC
jgi:hypothetical protein